MAEMNNSITDCYGLLYAYSARSNDLVTFSAVFTSCICLSVGFGAVLGNSLVLYVTYQCKMYKTSQNILLINLALTDLLTGAFVIPTNISLRVLEILGRHSCFLEVSIKICGHTLSGVSGLSIALLAVDRCIAVKYPIKRRVWNLKRKFKTALLFCWTYVTIIVTCYAWKVLSASTGRKIMAGSIVCAILIVTISYFIICYELRARAQRVSQLGTTSTQKERNSVITCALIALVFFVSYAPRMSVTFTSDELTRYHLNRWSALSIFANSALNPFIYFYRKEAFKREILKVFRRLRCKAEAASDQI